MKSNLKIAGILNIIFSAISFILTFFNYSFVSFISGFLSFGFLLASGVIFLNLSNLSEKELYYKKDLIIVLGAILVMFNLISALLVLISSSKLTSYQNNITNDNYLETPIKPKIDKETRRIDILLKLGTAMVLISGIIFSTTTWHSISAGFKVFFLIIGSILLFALSKFTEKKLQLTKSSFVYFLLGSSFLVFAFLSIGYFNLFGPYFCMKGHLSDLYFSSLFAIIMIISAIIYHKYNYKTFIIIGLFSLLLSVIYFFLSFNIKEGIVTIIILSFLLISNLFIKEEQKTLKTFITILIITMGFIFIPYLLTLENPYILVANSILLIANLAVILFKDQKISTRILSIILINLIIPFTIIYLNIRYGATMVFIVGILSILYILSTFTKLLENKALNIAYQITYNTIIIYTLLISLFAKAEDLFFIAFIVMLTNIY